MASSYPAYGNAAQPQPQYPYPPSNNLSYGNSTTTFNNGKTPNDDARRISRTPSPTPSEEAELLRDGILDYKALMNWRFWIRRDWLWYYVIGGIILILTILITVLHTQLVHALTPVTNWMHGLKVGWLIPIAVLFVISFPPLFGHEIVAILCGLVWGLGVGFAIVAAGTFLGELGNFYAFKYCCRARGEKLEREKITYACLAKVVRDGGFKVALIARLSVMPGHFTTAIFSTCGMSVWVFSVACILSMPKQFITVYLGVILEQSGTGTETTKNKVISDVVLLITLAITAAAMWYLMRLMKQAKPDVIYARRKARQAKIERADFTPYAGGANQSSASVFNASETDMPLNNGDMPYGGVGGAGHQQWDKHGKAVGYSGDPRIFQPQPQRTTARVPTYRTEGGGGYDSQGHRYDSGPGGVAPLRQESGDSVDWDTDPHNQQGEESIHLPRVDASPPRIASPPGIHSPLNLHNPFDAPVPSTARQASYPSPIPPPTAPMTAPILGRPPGAAPPAAQFATYQSQPPAISTSITSPPLPNPYGVPDVTPTQFNHPQVPSNNPFHGQEATDDSFFTADGHSRATTENAPTPFAPPPHAPPGYDSAGLR